MQLSRLALSKAKNSLRQLESFALKSNEALGERKKIKELIKNVQKKFYLWLFITIIRESINVAQARI
ncbi:hypothetical protein [Borreliella bavariensis]